MQAPLPIRQAKISRANPDITCVSLDINDQNCLPYPSQYGLQGLQVFSRREAVFMSQRRPLKDRKSQAAAFHVVTRDRRLIKSSFRTILYFCRSSTGEMMPSSEAAWILTA
ncbi:hypothetical protein IG631_07986 [Alternaria alternata]|nr:hypothetical protein IG631_07986 [Alternaria alternata]